MEESICSKLVVALTLSAAESLFSENRFFALYLVDIYLCVRKTLSFDDQRVLVANKIA